VALKVRDEVLTVRVVAVKPVTFRVTVAVSVPAVVVMEIVPVHTVPPAIPEGFTETVKFAFDTPAVKIPDGERDSQVTVVQVCSDTCAVALVLVWADTASVCDAGLLPPTVALNVKAEELKVKPDTVGAVTLRVTVADCVPEAVIMEIVPVHVVPAVRPN
jgi:hypothetical protein